MPKLWKFSRILHSVAEVVREGGSILSLFRTLMLNL